LAEVAFHPGHGGLGAFGADVLAVDEFQADQVLQARVVAPADL